MNLEFYAGYISAFQNDDVWIFEPSTVKSVTYGSVSSGWIKSGPFKGSVQPYSGELAFNDYGEKAEYQKRVFLSPDVNVSEGWGIAFSDLSEPELIIKWAPLYKTHRMILAGTK